MCNSLARSSVLSLITLAICITRGINSFTVIERHVGIKALAATQNELNEKKRFVSPRVRKMNIERAIANKKKREPAGEKKRRLMKLFKDAQRRDRLDSIVTRPIGIWDKSRVPLSSLESGNQLNGTVISLTSYGVYVDVGSECDGLLHISQLSDSTFVEHPRQLFTPGQSINVTVYRVSPELKKLQLSLLSQEHNQILLDDSISLDELTLDEELWGEITRVTDYGAFVDLGAAVQGFLHFMDHPEFPYREEEVHPSKLMRVGQRVRLWVSKLDLEKGRIQLTGIRPKTLPLLKREYLFN